MRKALIVWGGWPGHRPRETADIIAGFLDADGFAPTVTEDLARLGGTDIGEMDLVVPIVTNAEIERPDVWRLIAAVRAGTGLAGPHMAMATSFRSVVEFHYMTGVQWVAHPGDIIDYRVNITRPDDPLVAGIDDFDYHSEQYYLHYDPTIDILATTTFTGEHDPNIEGVVMPVVFKRRFGDGRIFYSALGHVPEEYSHPQAQTILRRGLSWAARGSNLPF
jgi:type 1 glutamine amidotransferase